MPRDILPYRAHSPGFSALVDALEDYPPLGAEEEQRLGAIVRCGDTEAAQRAVETLTLHNIRLVISIAKKYAGPQLGLSELVDEGVIGLIKAARGFSDESGMRFSTYAWRPIEQAMFRAMTRAANLIYVPQYIATLRGHIKRVTNAYLIEQGREPTFAELQQATSATEGELHLALHVHYDVVSLDSAADTASTARDDDDAPLADILADPSTPVDILAFDRIEQADLYATLRRILTTRELVIIAFYYRLGDAHVPYSEMWDDEMTLDELGMRLRLSRERVRQLKEGALDKLRQAYGVDYAALLAPEEQADER